VATPGEARDRHDRRQEQPNPTAGDVGEHQKAGKLAMKYVVIYERGPENWGAFAPDLPGYGATAENLDELRELVREGIPFHVEGLRRAGEPVPMPTAIVDSIETA
jgi:predicted RNase H-like HicB family nuclease